MNILPQSKAHIGKRLETAAEIAAVRLSGEENIPLCGIDVGTDHAYLPILLVEKYGFSHVTACDINEGPCETARKNIHEAGKDFSERIDVVRTDGLSGLSEVFCNRITIAGMGGELIRDILRRADFLLDEKHRGKVLFVLQPQSRAHLLRDYLFETGYRIERDTLCEDGGKIYPVLSAVYDGTAREESELCRYFGSEMPRLRGELFARDFLSKYARLKQNSRARGGKCEGRNAAVHAREERLLSEMEQYLKENPL